MNTVCLSETQRQYVDVSCRSISQIHLLLPLNYTENCGAYRMDLNFRGTKLSRIENFRVFRVFIFADARPTILYYIYRLYICTNMCFAYKPYI